MIQRLREAASSGETLIAVVADQRRRGMGADLAVQVDANYLNIDTEARGCTWNHSTAWRALAEAAPQPGQFCLVLEDDAVPVEGFRDQLTAALAEAPAGIVSLYLGRGYIDDRRTENFLRRAEVLDTNWIVTHGRIMHAVALAVRSDLITELVDNLPTGKQPFDRALSMWTRRRGHQIAYSWPSLVDHADHPSLVTRYNRSERRAWRTGVREDWHDKMMHMV